MKPWVAVRGTLLVVALTVGVAGMALEWRALVWVAAALLAVAVVIRLRRRRREEA